jgi:hypothetical protein
MTKIQTRLLMFSILPLLSSACAAPSTSFDGKWQMIEVAPTQPPMACLPEDDVLKLRALLIRCEASK